MKKEKLFFAEQKVTAFIIPQEKISSEAFLVTQITFLGQVVQTKAQKRFPQILME